MSSSNATLMICLGPMEWPTHPPFNGWVDSGGGRVDWLVNHEVGDCLEKSTVIEGLSYENMICKYDCMNCKFYNNLRDDWRWLYSWWLMIGKFNEATREKEHCVWKTTQRTIHGGFGCAWSCWLPGSFWGWSWFQGCKGRLILSWSSVPPGVSRMGAPVWKRKHDLSWGVRLQEGMSQSQGWHLVVKIFQLALPNSHEHPNAIGISNDNGSPQNFICFYILHDSTCRSRHPRNFLWNAGDAVFKPPVAPCHFHSVLG